MYINVLLTFTVLIRMNTFVNYWKIPLDLSLLDINIILIYHYYIRHIIKTSGCVQLVHIFSCLPMKESVVLCNVTDVISALVTTHPSTRPSTQPYTHPATHPTNHHPFHPTNHHPFHPTNHPPTLPSTKPTINPSIHPSIFLGQMERQFYFYFQTWTNAVAQ